jgi:hypothetical protein
MLVYLLLNVLFPAVCGWFGSKARWSLRKTLVLMCAIWIPLQLLVHYRGVCL